MAIVAVCPYCRVGKVTTAERTAVCPQCRSSFPVAAAKPKPAPKPKPAAAETKPVAATAPRIPVPPPPISPAEPVAAADPPAFTSVSPAAADPTYPLALIGFACAGLGLLASQFPYGRGVTVTLAVIGLLLGCGSFLLADRGRKFGAAAAGLNAFALGLVLLLPSWLGLASWDAPGVPAPPAGAQAVTHGGGGTKDADWVDASSASWAFDDVQVSLVSAVFDAVELAGPNGKTRRTKEKYLQLRVRAANAGVARKIELQPWAGANAPKLTDPAGAAISVKTFEAGWDAADRPTAGSLLPGKSAVTLFVFEVPAAKPAAVKLELPGAAVGLADQTVKLKIAWPANAGGTVPPPRP